MAKFSVERINTIIRAFSLQKYLEVGVQRGLTFGEIECSSKTGVDIKFRFNWRSAASENVSLYEATSDEFFCEINKAVYDIVFLDGLHTFSQTLRDLNNTLLCTHDKSIIIIDDTIPVDIYSSFPNHDDALYLRESSGGKGKAWHGDVYKLIFYIAEFFPALSYRTIREGGNPQTILWRNPRRCEGIGISLSDISTLDFLFLQRNMEVMHIDDSIQSIIDQIGVDFSSR